MSDWDFEIEQLNFAIEHETSMRSNLEKENQDVERSINELEGKIFEGRNDPNDSDWGRKYLTQVDVNVELKKQISLVKEKMKQLAEVEPDYIDSNHPSKLNESDLKNLLKQLERDKHALEGNLKDLEWRLDTESQDLFRLNEEKEKYKLDLDQAMSIVDDARLRSKSPNPAGKSTELKFSSKKFNNTKNRDYGIPNNHRILDARKGPVKKTAAVKTLPMLGAAIPSSTDSTISERSKKKKPLSRDDENRPSL